MTWSRMRWVFIGLAVAVALLVSVRAFWPGRSNGRAAVPAVTAEQVEEIEILVEGFQQRREETFRTRDPAAVAAFLAVFDTARPTTEHKCATWARVTIRTKDGAEEVLGLLPGHDPQYYEYRYARTINRVDRGRFLAAMEAVGVKDVKLTAP